MRLVPALALALLGAAGGFPVAHVPHPRQGVTPESAHLGRAHPASFVDSCLWSFLGPSKRGLRSKDSVAGASRGPILDMGMVALDPEAATGKSIWAQPRSLNPTQTDRQRSRGRPRGRWDQARQPASPLDEARGRVATVPRADPMQITGWIRRCGTVRELALIINQHYTRLNHIHVSAAWSCLARMRVNGGLEDQMAEGSLALLLVSRTEEVLGRMGGREIANVLYAHARLHTLGRVHGGDRILAVLVARASAHAEKGAQDFNAQEVSNVLWALAKMEIGAPAQLLEAMETRALATAALWDPQGVANLFWAFAKMERTPSAALLAAMGRQAVSTVRAFTPQGVSSFMWSLGSLSAAPDPEVLAAMDRRALEIVQEFGAQNLANFMWAHARLGARVSPELYDALGARVVEIAREFKPQELANFMWASATMELTAGEPLLAAVSEQAVARAHEFRPQDVSNLLWALATTGARADAQLVAAMQQRAFDAVADFKPQEVANLLWASSCLELSLPAGLFDAMTARCLALRSDFAISNKLQLHQWILSCEVDGLADAGATPRQALGNLAPECKRAFGRVPTLPSHLQRVVAGALRRCLSTRPDLEVLEEFRDPRSAYSIDVLVRPRAAGPDGRAQPAWAVEVDGPAHFLRSRPGGEHAPTGSTRLKRRHLARLGYTLVSVPYFEWNTLGGAEDEAARYLEGKLGV